MDEAADMNPGFTAERCVIPPGDPVYQHYHDTEWGVPIGDDLRLFEKLCLEGFQSGLSWRTILHRRADFRTCFNHFDPAHVLSLTQTDVERLAADPRIIRNRRKIQSVINNANRVADLQQEFGSLAAFFWQFEPGPASRPKKVTLDWLAGNPHTPESIALSAALKARGWTFVGPTNMYALMQATGMVNDHVDGCPRRVAIDQLRASFKRPGL